MHRVRSPDLCPPATRCWPWARRTRRALRQPGAGPLFDFAPAIDRFLKAHLFGAIFARDNLDWPSRELATLGVLSALPGVEPQLLAHLRIGMNVGLTEAQLREFANGLSAGNAADAGQRMRAALDKHLGTGGSKQDRKDKA